MSKKEQTLIEACEAFNDLYPVGTKLIVMDDYGNPHARILKSGAWVLGGHSVVANFEGLSGCYSIIRVKHMFTYKTNDFLGVSYCVPADADGKAV